eukprot:7602387-Pyramimonas_sp.AAC.1
MEAALSFRARSLTHLDRWLETSPLPALPSDERILGFYRSNNGVRVVKGSPVVHRGARTLIS